jgi:uncharacterized membrane protein
MLDKIKIFIHKINTSKILAGIVMLLLNVGSKYIEIGLSQTQEQALRNALTRELLIFAVVFMATHDIIISILMTAAFVILSQFLFNDESKYCIVSKKMKKIKRLVDVNKDNIVSEEEEERALEILKKAKKQKKKQNQMQFINYMEENKYSEW